MSRRAGKSQGRVLVTAGPTREHIDPIRFISNHSTGTFGYEIAREARRRGRDVTLVSGPTALRAPKGVKLINVESALDMRKAVIKEFPQSGCVIMAAAVSDWRPRSIAAKKIKRRSGPRALELVENPDILASLGRKKGGKVLVGFAVETDDVIRNAIEKLKEKNLDLIIANRADSKQKAFGNNPTDISIIDRSGRVTGFARKDKRELAKIILDKIFRFNI